MTDQKNNLGPICRKQGMTLITCLILLMLFTMIGLAALNSTRLQSQMVGLELAYQQGLQGAEEELIMAEWLVHRTESFDQFTEVDGKKRRACLASNQRLGQTQIINQVPIQVHQCEIEYLGRFQIGDDRLNVSMDNHVPPIERDVFQTNIITADPENNVHVDLTSTFYRSPLQGFIIAKQ